MKNIPWAKPLIDKNEIKHIKECFVNDRFTQGPKVKLFEKKLQNFLKCKYVVAVSNGTVALDLAYKAIGLKGNDEVILPAMSYISTASAISYQGGVPVFVDIDPLNNCIDPDKIESAISKKTKAISFIDYGGNPANHKKIFNISKKYNIPIIHDGAQSLGAYLEKKPLGANGTISTMSFHMAKIITTIEGGAVFTNSLKYYKKLLILRNIGETPSKKYHHVMLGTNARMTELQAGFGLAQIEKLRYIIKERNRVAKSYDAIFKNISFVKTLGKLRNAKNANFFYPIMIPRRDLIAKKLKEDYGIETRVAYSMPIYAQPMYKNQKLKFKKQRCKNTENVAKKILNLPIYPKMKDADIKYVGNAIIKLLSFNNL